MIRLSSFLQNAVSPSQRELKFSSETKTHLSLGRRAWQIHQENRTASPFKSRLSARVLSSSCIHMLASPKHPFLPQLGSVRGADLARPWLRSPLLGTIWRLCGRREFVDIFLHGAPPLHLSMILL